VDWCTWLTGAAGGGGDTAAVVDELTTLCVTGVF
jgi:hypothetical protein